MSQGCGKEENMRSMIVIFVSLISIGCASVNDKETSKQDTTPKPDGTCPGIRDKNPNDRLKAVSECTDDPALFEVAKLDTETAIRVAAIKKILDVRLIEALCAHFEQDDTVTDAKRGIILKYLQKKAEVLRECPGIGAPTHEERKQAIKACKNDSALMLSAKYDPIKSLRLLAAYSMNYSSNLKSFQEYLKDDPTLSQAEKNVFYKRIKMRLDANADMVVISEMLADNKLRTSRYSEEPSMAPEEEKLLKKRKTGTDTDLSNTGEKTDVMTEQVKKVLAESRGTKSCYEQALRRDPTLSGKVIVRMTVAVGGKVKSAKVVKDEIGNSQLRKCVTKAVKRLNFPPLSKSQTFDYPMLFQPGL